MLTTVAVGCDPGASGSIVTVSFCDGKFDLITTFRLKEMGTELNQHCLTRNTYVNKWMMDVPYEFRGVFCEKVASRTGQGVCSVFSFGWNTGAVWQALHLIEKPQMVTPQKWQKHFGLVFPKSLGLTKTEKKNRHKQYVHDRFGLDLVHAEVDAFLIACYGAGVEAQAN